MINIAMYLTLNDEEEAEFQRILTQSEEPEVREMLSIYEERGVVKGKRDWLLKLLHSKFGVIPDQVETRLRDIYSEAELETLLERLLTAHSLADMRLEEVSE